MPYLQVVVCRKHGKWLIRSADAGGQAFADQRSAAKAAVDLAYQSGKDGKPAQVVMQNGKSFETIWTYGADSYPPHLPF